MLERHLRIGQALNDEALIEMSLAEHGVNMVKGDPALKFKKVYDPAGKYIFD